jgi:hypothetical protein
VRRGCVSRVIHSRFRGAQPTRAIKLEHLPEHRHSIVDDSELDRLTIAELEALKLRVEDTVRAKIRAKRLAKMPPPALVAVAPKMDLEQARDAWMNGRRQR